MQVLVCYSRLSCNILKLNKQEELKVLYFINSYTTELYELYVIHSMHFCSAAAWPLVARCFFSDSRRTKMNKRVEQTTFYSCHLLLCSYSGIVVTKKQEENHYYVVCSFN